MANDYLFGGNAVFIEELYDQYKQNPSSVDGSWRELFDQASGGNSLPSWEKKRPRIIGAKSEDFAKTELPGKAQNKNEKPGAAESTAVDSIRALMLIRAYRERGHTIANLDPLGLKVFLPGPELDPKSYGFTNEHDSKEIYLNGQLGLDKATLPEIMRILLKTYAGNIGFEYEHITHPEQRAFLREKIEPIQAQSNFSKEQKEWLLESLTEVEGFEQFIHVKFTGTKRFSIEGGDVAIPAINYITEVVSGLGVDEICIGMPHRGRLNVLTAVMGKPYAAMLSEFYGNLSMPEGVGTSGDVKYHMGYSHDVKFGERKVHLSLASNPSHLEAVNSVVTGKVRAKQDQKKDVERSRVMSIVLHGDAAFAGQGSVAENFVLSDLEGYRTGGTIHIIVNNQIGFTTDPIKARSSPYPSDVAKMVGAPIFHVNGDDPESVLLVSRIAAEFRQQFKIDVVLDIVCYRRYGHNEGDEPMFTQPIMYDKIRDLPRPRELYARKLVAENTITADEATERVQKFKDYLEEQYKIGKDYKPNKVDSLEGQWEGFQRVPRGTDPTPDTGVDLKMLKEIGKALSTIPETFNPNAKIVKLMGDKKKMFETGEGIDWSTAEALAFGSLLAEGKRVRLSGQDCGRGTFSQRHSVLVDQKTEEDYVPLNNLGIRQAPYEVVDSALSEFAVLGFDYGYSLAEPNALTLWEAQFGDFSNGAQVIIDQFIASGEAKWLRMSGLVMLLPHGYEGQGPEHSSARLERYLQSCGEENIQVANCTTAANYFHILRRQLKRNFRKPLIIMTPKSLLRKKEVFSSLEEFAPGTTFKRIIPEVENLAADIKIRKVVICSGKVYYDIAEKRDAEKMDDVAIIRLEQFYPFPMHEMKAELAKYKNAEFIWLQEEPKNMGGWLFVRAFIDETLEQIGLKKRVTFAGRISAASPATGFYKIHNKEQEAIVAMALS